MPDQTGRRIIVTGGNSGLGLETVRALAARCAHVVMAVRDTAKGEAAAAGIAGDVDVRRLDLADLESVRDFAAKTTDPVDVLVNNAGVMAVPLLRTADGFEMQFGTNHLGHFALTGLLLESITDRVVVLSSFLHRHGRIRLDDPNWRHGYRRWHAYAQSKLANLMFTYELQKRATAAESPLRAVAAHPGYAATNLQSRTESPLADPLMWLGNRVIAQSARAGAWPTLYAATEPDLPGGWFVGPDGPGGMRGHPRPVSSSKRSYDDVVQRRLWELSESLTGVRYHFRV